MSPAWIHLEPLTPLTFRDGRGWGGEAAGDSLGWPPPSQLLGAACSAWGEAHGFGWDFARADARALQRLRGEGGPPISILGPLPARRTPEGQARPLWPAPHDRLEFPLPREKRVRVGLRPGRDPALAQPPTGLDAPLHPLRHPDPETDAKPGERAPWEDGDTLSAWLGEPDATRRERRGDDDAGGPEESSRVHVAIDPLTHTAVDGALYRLGAVEFPDARRSGARWHREPLGLLLRVDGLPDDELTATLARPWRLGGRGGLARARRVEPAWGRVREAPRAHLKGHRFRHVLVTPARYRRGWLPDWIDADGTGALPGVGERVRLVAAAVPQPQVVSGWDLQAGSGDRSGRSRGAPRAARRLVPAGAVYFYEALDSRFDASVLLDRLWMEPLASLSPDDDAGRLDARCGLGAGVFGTWNYWKE